jgi:hypothetical protein
MRETLQATHRDLARHQLQPASSFAMWSCLYSAIQTRLDFWLQYLTPEETEATHATLASPRLLEGGRRNEGARGRRVAAGGAARAPDKLEA